MNFDDIQKTWQSPHNRPDAAQLERDKVKFVADLRRRRRGNLLFLALIFVMLVAVTARLGVHLLEPASAAGATDLSREWSVVLILSLPWLGWLALAGVCWRHHARNPHHGRSIHASVSALLDENRAERMRYKIIACLLIASVAAAPLVVFQLQAVGKAGDEIWFPALVLYPAYVAAVLVSCALRYRRKLLPRKRELEALLATYREAGLA